MSSGLNYLWSVASSGIHSRQRHLDLLSHNVANSNTVGFKQSWAGFQAVIRERTLGADEAALFAAADEGDLIQEGMGTLLTRSSHIFTQGSLRQTHDPHHMAIGGDGLFQVTDPDGTLLYTRAGDFQRDAGGRLVNSNGYLLTPQVAIPDEVREIYIDPQGRIFGHVPGDPDPQQLGAVQVALFANLDGLENVGDSAFVATEASGPVQMGAPGAGGRGTLQSGFLEDSNVDLGREMTTLLRTQRAYSMSVRALQTADEIYRMANELPRP